MKKGKSHLSFQSAPLRRHEREQITYSLCGDKIRLKPELKEIHQLMAPLVQPMLRAFGMPHQTVTAHQKRQAHWFRREAVARLGKNGFHQLIQQVQKHARCRGSVL